MQYSNIHLRAGLVALVFALIISLVSAAPIPATESGLSFILSPHQTPSHVLVEDDINTVKKPRHPAAIRALTRRSPTSTDMDDQLVRRSKVKRAFQRFGHKIKKSFQKAGKAIKKGFKKVGRGIVTAAKKVGHFMKTTGAKIAKFGLKVVQAIGTGIAKVVSFVPGIGKVVGKAIGGVAKVAGVVSTKIHANLGRKLEKGMSVMNKADKIMGHIPRRRELSKEEAFQQRDIGDANHFEERDDITLEDRDESYFEANKWDIYERYDLDEE